MDKPNRRGLVVLDITLQRIKKIELVRAVIELEKRGWTCLIPIRAVTGLRKEFTYKEKGIVQNDKRSYNRFSEASEFTVYKTVMRKLEK